MSAKDILDSIISNPLDSEKGKFDLEKFIRFFRAKNNKLSYPKEQLYYTGDNFGNGRKLAEGKLDDGELIVCSFSVKKELTERSGKKKQYQLGKKILKDDQKDAGIFIFYDARGDFRFSLIYTNYLGKRRDWSNFKRFTYFVSKDFTNKTFLNQVGNGVFTTLEKIKEAFSVEPVTKQFYAEIQTWYFWAMDKIKFPDDYKYSEDTAKYKEISNATNLIRLITRIIFIWFLKEKDLIPAKLFLKDELKTIVKDFMKDNSSSNFYNAILQNLFFGTLNQKMNERKFAEDNGFHLNKKEYGVKNLYRYADKFLISKNEVLKLFEGIPFLNGGLFDCLDKENETGKVIYIDGFSRNKAKQTIIPDYLFFQKNEEKVDLSQYGLGSNKPVRGLFEILNNYNFTIDENTPIDQEIALDPELLGKVFENLLASYNPETATTARKATGSYYTPREIVDYMVEASLLEYLKEKLPDIKEEKIKSLLSYSEEIPEFSEKERQKIISAIDEIKILDPACGSGAFPMGVLHKLVFALQKLDPENKYWHELQYQKALEETGEVFKQFKQEDKSQREERLKEINETFDDGINYPDYARKLYLIENCIYGVDIQPIAIQISKLRFFISLVLDQKKADKNKENFGIRALPNLETRFVAADTLIGLEIPKEYELFQNTEVKQILDKLAKERHKYFNANTRREKLDYQKQDKNLREGLAKKVEEFLTKQIQDEVNQIKRTINEEELKLKKIIEEPEDIETVEQRNLFGEIKQIKIDKKEERIKAIKRKIKEYEKNLESIQKQLEGDFFIKIAKKIASFDLYDQNAFADFFDSEWMFGVKDGFDIVIANPPYIQLQNEGGKLAKLYEKLNYETFARTGDIYALFYERGIQLLKDDGLLCFITSNKWMRAGYGEKLRNFFAKYNPQILIDLGPGIFETATVDTNILLIQKKPNEKKLRAVTLQREDNEPIDIKEQLNNHGVVLTDLTKDAWFIGSATEQKLKEKIERIAKPLKEWDVKIYRGVLTGLNEAFIIDSQKRKEILNNCKDEEERRRTEAIIKPILRGRDIKRYYYKWAGLWVIIIPAGWTNENRKNKKPDEFIYEQFPALMDYLKQYEEKAKKRDDQGDYWWELRSCTYYHEFEKKKIFFKAVGRNLTFSTVEPGIIVTAPASFLTGKNLYYLLGFLCSKLTNYYVEQISDKTGAGDIMLNVQSFERIRIPPITPANQSTVQQIEELVTKIISAKKENSLTDTSQWEQEIDRLVYSLYGLTEEEVEVIENGK